MSNNLVSQQLQLPTPSMQMGQLEPIVNKVDSSGRDLPMGFLGPVSSGTMSQQLVASNDHDGLSRAMPGNPASQEVSMSIMQSVPVQSRTSNLGMHQLFMPNRQSMQNETMMNSGPKQMSMTPKRKAPMEPLSSNSVMPNKKVTQAEHRPWLQPISPSNKGAQQSSAPGIQHSPALSKRKTQMEPASGRLGGARSLNSKVQTAQVQQSSKVQTESSESVRSKMRESLSAALALVSQLDKPQVANNSSSNEAINAQGKLESSSQSASLAAAASDAARGNKQETTDSVDTSSTIAVSDDSAIVENRLISTSNEDFPSEKSKDGEAAVTNISSNQNVSNSMLDSYSDRQDFQLSYTLTTDDVPFSDNFFVKDELLQGNGLSWVLESEIEMETQKEGQINEELRSQPDEVGGGGGNEQFVQSPELLASRIEAELFKLFGGVNKKYKEKGRSLLFNLKDRNNPELRERVMCGEIPPGRLCSMTAEELASKELSEWRIAKAQELAQMVVLPNSDVDVRRLVKKTHKGEYQVEVEHDDKVSVEVSGGVSSVSQSLAKRKDAEAPSSEPDGIKGDAITGIEKSNLEKDNQCALTIPSNDGADLMQGLMADDALKEADFLPPIVSLDEFMESLHSEPPFENLTAESEKASTNSDKDGLKVGPDFKSSDLIPSYQVEGNTDKSDKDRGTCSHVDAAGLEKRMVNAEAGLAPSETKCSEIHADSKSTDELADVKPTDGHAEVRSIGEIKSDSDHTEMKANQCPARDRDSGSHLYVKAAVSTVVSKGEHIWEGTLQLSISATQYVMGIFKSGEKTSVKDWPGSLEIKGRVRLDAFEKFLQELPLSRTRAVMVVHFVSKEESPRNEQSALREVADSYIIDERVGFAEPVPRVELYFCPPHRKTVEMLSKIIPKEHIEEVNAIDFGLIGLIVWRKTHVTSTISPTSSSHHKHSSKKQYLSSRKQQQDMNSSLASKPGPVMGFTTIQPGPSSDDDDDDIPPGFGPAASRDEDDLPEFNFSGGSNPSMSRLVQKPTGPGMAPFQTAIQTTAGPVENLRQLVHKYGQGQAISSPRNWQEKSGVTIQPWNDDDDDIPEWQPQAPQNQFPQQHNFQPRGHTANQSYAISQQQQRMLPMQSLQPPMNVTQRNTGLVWASSNQGNNVQPSNINYGVPTTQGIAWRQNDPRSRGF